VEKDSNLAIFIEKTNVGADDKTTELEGTD
jgi:hypothetical protein